MAIQKGRGWHGDADGHKKAGRKGGLSTARTHDTAFYSEIGRKGGKASTGNFKNDPERARIAGRKGGRA
jgi:general stress protein YciG